MISFIKLKSGKWHPVECAEAEEYRVWTEPPMIMNDGETLKRFVLISEEGEVLPVWAKISPIGRLMDGPCRILGWESHFAACPKADQFRRA